jgi:hypothetical protein
MKAIDLLLDLAKTIYLCVDQSIVVRAIAGYVGLPIPLLLIKL